MKQYTLTPKSLYGEDWFKDHGDKLKCWRWDFRPAESCDTWLIPGPSWKACRGHSNKDPRIVLLSVKTPIPKLHNVYGTEIIVIPYKYEWAGEFRSPTHGDRWLDSDGVVCQGNAPGATRLILRDRVVPTRTYFKCYPEPRIAKRGEYVVHGSEFRLVDDSFIEKGCNETKCTYIIATKYTKIDTRPTYVTQDDIDRVFKAMELLEEE